jgi:hypothetical protein
MHNNLYKIKKRKWYCTDTTILQVIEAPENFLEMVPGIPHLCV